MFPFHKPEKAPRGWGMLRNAPRDSRASTKPRTKARLWQAPTQDPVRRKRGSGSSSEMDPPPEDPFPRDLHLEPVGEAGCQPATSEWRVCHWGHRPVPKPGPQRQKRTQGLGFQAAPLNSET